MKKYSLIVFAFLLATPATADSTFTCEFDQKMKLHINYLDLPNKRNTPFFLQAELFDLKLSKWKKTRIYLPKLSTQRRIEKIGMVDVHSFRDDRHKATLDLSPTSFDPNSGLLIIKKEANSVSIWLKGYLLRYGHMKRTLLWSNLNPLSKGKNLSIDSKEHKLSASTQCYET